MIQKARSKRHSKKKEEIIAMSYKMVQEEGLSSFTLQDLLSKMSIGVGTFYYYFSSKEDLLYETLIYNDKLFVQSFNDRYSFINSSIEKIRLFLQEQAKVVPLSSSEFLNNYWHILNNEVMAFYFDANQSPKYKLLISIIEEGQQRNEIIPSIPAKRLAEVIWTMMAGAADFSNRSNAYRIEKRVSVLADTLLPLLSVADTQDNMDK